MDKKLIVLLTALVLAGCQGNKLPKDTLSLGPKVLEKRQIQTRQFKTIEEANLLAASAAVLQDMGYTIDESETKLGLICASKNRETDNEKERNFKRGLNAVLTLANAMSGKFDSRTTRLDGVDAKQKIRVALVARPDESNNKTNIRVTFQREVWDVEGTLICLETLEQPNLYEGFFSRLSKSVFLEAHKV